MKLKLIAALTLVMAGCVDPEPQQDVEDGEVDRCSQSSTSASSVLWTELCSLVDATCGGTTRLVTLQSSSVKVEEDESIWTEHQFIDEAGNVITAGEPCGSAQFDGCGRSVGSCLLRESHVGDSLVVVLTDQASFGEAPALYTFYQVLPDRPLVDPNGDDTTFETPLELVEAWSLKVQQRPGSAVCGSGTATSWCSSPVEIYE